MAGYWNKPEQTAETFVDGWLHSGDLARVDDDGFVQIVDRKKDMVNRGGENVYCVEVENALVAHPAVFEVAVVGVPDAMMGEKVGAIVVLHPGMELTATELTAFAREQLADFKVPQYVIVPRRAPAPQPGRQGAQAHAPQGDRVGSTSPHSVTERHSRRGKRQLQCARARLGRAKRRPCRAMDTSGVEVVELGAGPGPGGLHQPTGGRQRDVGSGEVVPAEADVRREQVARRHEVDQLALG